MSTVTGKGAIHTVHGSSLKRTVEGTNRVHASHCPHDY